MHKYSTAAATVKAPGGDQQSGEIPDKRNIPQVLIKSQHFIRIFLIFYDVFIRLNN